MKMIRAAAAFLIAGLLLFFACAPTAFAEDAAPVSTTAAAYLVMDADTGQVLMGKNADEIMPPASIIKIMILGLACQKAQGNWDVELTVDQAVLDNLEQGASHIALRPGEVVRLEDMLYATCMQSACDSASVLAEYVGGTIEGGVEAMNAQAQMLGLHNTHFSNPTGLYEEDLYSTTRDMAVVTRWAMQQPGFSTIFGRSDTWVMAPTNVQEKSRYFYIDDHMRLGGYTVFRSYVTGSKSGWHDQAKYTLVSSAEQDGIRLIGVLFQSSTRVDKFNDMAALLDTAFARFHQESVSLKVQSAAVPVYGGGKALGSITLTTPSSVQLLLADNTVAENIETSLSFPQQYVMGTHFEPAITISMPGNDTQSSVKITAPMSISGLDAILSANTGSVLAADDYRVWSAKMLAVALVLGAGWGGFVLVRHVRGTKSRKTARAQKQPAVMTAAVDTPKASRTVKRRSVATENAARRNRSVDFRPSSRSHDPRRQG